MNWLMNTSQFLTSRLQILETKENKNSNNYLNPFLPQATVGGFFV